MKELIIITAKINQKTKGLLMKLRNLFSRPTYIDHRLIIYKVFVRPYLNHGDINFDELAILHIMLA